MKNIITILLLFTVQISFGQEKKLYSKIYVSSDRKVSKFTVADSGNFRIWYTMNATGMINKIDSCDDLQVLEIGENISKYYSSFIFKADSATEIANKKIRSSGSAYRTMGLKGQCPVWPEYFKDFKTGIFTEYARMPRFVPHYYYSEEIPVQDWVLNDDTLTVVGYICQKATCRFRGRDYTAWFAPDIPINNGPWKFGGLPGLILKVYDTSKEFVFECAGMDPKTKFNIKKFDYSTYKKSDRKKVLKLLNNIDEDYLKVTGGTVVGNYSGNPWKSPNKPQYNTMLIELE
jgi:GLPGLI family protein